ncbi:MAG TPA: hypothetical protein VKR79_01640 [Gaiellaceae bacterium]|nr:hypothetical protein [Gaiellaceae bacterium]
MLARHREALVAAAVAASVAALLAWLAPPGGDMAAHVYQRGLFLRNGFTLWDNYWYAGRYAFVGYSVLYYPLSALLGILPLAVLTVAVSAGAFAALLEREWGASARWASGAFAALWAGVLITGEFPFALGIALALLALLALQAGRRWAGALLILLVVAASPVAFVVLAAVLIGAGLGLRRHSLIPAAALFVAAVAELVLLQLFPAGGTLGFPWSEALEAVAFCLGGIALTRDAANARILRGIFGVYLVAVALSWAVPSGLGHDVARIRLLALPVALLLASLRRWRPLPVVLAAVALAAVWNVWPLAAGWTASAADGSAAAKVWTAPVAYLHAHLRPGYRVEAVDTSQHWSAYYLAGEGIPLVRGWFRQDDFPFNELLYERFTPAEYLSWLRGLGVAYVVLTRFPPDHTSRAEAQLVRSGAVFGLKRVFATADVAIYAVPDPRPITSAHVIALHQASLTIRVPRAAIYRIAVRWSPYWHASAGRLSEARDGTIELRTTTPGVVRITFAP